MSILHIFFLVSTKDVCLAFLSTAFLGLPLLHDRQNAEVVAIRLEDRSPRQVEDSVNEAKLKQKTFQSTVLTIKPIGMTVGRRYALTTSW
jgi:hypothetical protein